MLWCHDTLFNAPILFYWKSLNQRRDCHRIFSSLLNIFWEFWLHFSFFVPQFLFFTLPLTTWDFFPLWRRPHRRALTSADGSATWHVGFYARCVQRSKKRTDFWVSYQPGPITFKKSSNSFTRQFLGASLVMAAVVGEDVIQLNVKVQTLDYSVQMRV